MPTAVITGANRGIGLEFALRYLERGWQVHALNRGGTDALAEAEADGRLWIHRGDLSVIEDLRRMARAVREAIVSPAGPDNRGIDLLIHNAGIMGTERKRPDGLPRQGLEDFDREEWRAVLDINLLAGVELMVSLRAQLAPGARIVMITSEMASNAGNDYGGWAAYRASKAAVNSVVKTFSMELADEAIIVALHPGWVRTALGGPNAPLDVETSVADMIRVIDDLGPGQSGAFIGHHGAVAPY